MEARVGSEARERSKRCRQPSFSDSDKHRTREATIRYARSGLDLVEIMFKLHEEGIADVPLDTFRTWIKEWKIPVRRRSRQPKFDSEKIRPHFEELYEQQYTLDQIVFIIYDRLGLPVTKSSYLKWRQKWGLPDRNNHVKLSPGAEAEMTGEIEGEDIVDLSELSLNPDCALLGDIIHVTTTPGVSCPTDIPNLAEIMDFDMIEIDPEKLPDILEEDLEGLEDFLDGNINHDHLEEYTDDTLYSSQNVIFQEQLSLIRPKTSRLDCHRSPSPLSMERILSNMYEQEMVSSIQTYFEWVRDPATLWPQQASSKRHDDSERLSLAKKQTWSFYSLSFAAAQNSASNRPERQRRAQVEWSRATQLITSALQQPTDRLLVCLLLLYTNAYTGEGFHMRSKNFHYLYLLSMHIAGRENPLTHILNVLALQDALPADAEIKIMAYLVNSMISIQSTDFATSFEARELHILMLQKWNKLADAKQHCDNLITFVHDHGPLNDFSHLLRAQRRAGRILFAQGRMEEARTIFLRVIEKWTALGKPCVFSKEYVTFEDLAKICKFEGKYADAQDYYQKALSFSNLAYGCDHGNSLRILEDLDKLKHEMIARGGMSRAAGQDDVGLQQEDVGNTTDYLQREQTRW